MSPQALPTTSAEITLGNMDGELATVVKLVERQPANPAALAQLATLHLEHGRIHGKLDEYDQALTFAEQAVKLAPRSPIAYRARAMARSRLHRFDEALADLQNYAELGDADGKEDAERRRAAVLQSLGRYAEARPIVEKWAKSWPRIETIGQLAALDGDEGRLEEAGRGFVEAQDHHPNVSPFPVVWLYLQEGLMWQRAGRFARARELFEAAHERLEPDVTVTSHFAAMLSSTGERDRAVALLRPLVEKSDDPEYAGQLAALLREAGDAAEADKLRARAAARYDELVRRHPLAFSDHAARFWLGTGGDAKKALPLARANLALRKTGESYELALEAGVAAAEVAWSCEVADQALAGGARRSAHLHVLAARAFEACNQKDRAAAELAAATAAK